MTPQEKDLLVRTIWGEAANEPPEGQAAIAHVVLNRVKAGQWGKDISSVVRAPMQFQAWDFFPDKLRKLSPGNPQYKAIADIVDKVVNGEIPDDTGGAPYYLNKATTLKMRGNLPKFAQGPEVTFGNHTFYGGKPVVDDLEKEFAGSLKAPPGSETPGTTLHSFEEFTPYIKSAPVDVPQEKFSGPLTKDKNDSALTSAGKFLGTAGVKAASSIAGLPGDLRSLARSGADLASGALGLPQAQEKPGLIPVPPSTQEILGKVQAKTGEYVPESGLGRTAMSAAQGALTSIPFGPGAALMGGVSGGISQATGDWLENPLLGAAAGLAAGLGGSHILGGPRTALSPAQLALAQSAERQGLRLTPSQMTSPNAYPGTPAQAEATTQAAAKLGGIQGELSRNSLRNREVDIGENMGRLERQVDLAYDPPLHQAINSIYADLPQDPTAANKLRRVLGTIQDGFTRNLGILPGQEFSELIKKGSLLDKLTKDPNTREQAWELKRALVGNFHANATPQISNDYHNLRTQYTVLQNLKPLVKSGPAGELNPLALQNQANKLTVTQNSPEALRDLENLGDTWQTFLNSPDKGNNLVTIAEHVLKNPGTRTKLVEGALGVGTAAGLGVGGAPAALIAGLGLPLAHGTAAWALQQYQNNPLFRNMLLSGRAPTLPGQLNTGAAIGAGQNLLMGQGQ